MEKKIKTVRTKFVKMRMNDSEYEHLEKLWKNTTHRHLSTYLRKICLQQPVIVKYRNQSADDFLSSMLQLKKDLNGISNNFNQAVKKLHILEKIPEFRTWLILNESLQRAVNANVEEIKFRIAQLYDEWLLK
ncbi:plasmid mobilization relaxosome protein MobC [Ilyomonas limi]|uniref:Plasmid mobilization relaxosome protein MobC n=1 Tax=Ilyomonas limi TaxID=2575867 RepID=A0A4U3KT30_9BACT|nr:plasmid mobilization relaxosome protein MobC [Ilyomonas limi]TKK64859.1 plasmid mobilization relaxosome protein MobC [Ilyomonas limi]